jgi:hypothetical protein
MPARRQVGVNAFDSGDIPFDFSLEPQRFELLQFLKIKYARIVRVQPLRRSTSLRSCGSLTACAELTPPRTWLEPMASSFQQIGND